MLLKTYIFYNYIYIVIYKYIYNIYIYIYMYSYRICMFLITLFNLDFLVLYTILSSRHLIRLKMKTIFWHDYMYS